MPATLLRAEPVVGEALSDQQIAHWRDKGFVFVRDLLPAALVNELATDKIRNVIVTSDDRGDRKERLAAVSAEVMASLAERMASGEVSSKDVKDVLDSLVKDAVRRRILDDNVRPDGRALTEIRPIQVQVGKIPRVHGSGLFMRGETHVLTIATLGTPQDVTLQEVRIECFFPADDRSDALFKSLAARN